MLDFQIEEKTALALHEKAPLLARVARERIGREFLKLLSGPGAEEQLLAYPEIYRICLPWGGDPRGMLRLPPECRLCWLLLPQKDPEAAVNAAKEALRLSKAESERLHLQLSLAHSLPEEEGLLELLQTREPQELLLALLPWPLPLYATAVAGRMSAEWLRERPSPVCS